MLFAARGQLGGNQPRQQIQRYAILDHAEKLAIQKQQLIERIHIGIDFILQLFIFFIEQKGKRAQQRVLALEIMIEGTLRRAGGLHDFIDGGIFIALFVKQAPRGVDDPAARVAAVVLHISNLASRIYFYYPISRAHSQVINLCCRIRRNH